MLDVPDTFSQSLHLVEKGGHVQFRAGNQRGAFPADVANRLDGGVQGQVDLAVEIAQLVRILGAPLDRALHAFSYAAQDNAEEGGEGRGYRLAIVEVIQYFDIREQTVEVIADNASQDASGRSP